MACSQNFAKKNSSSPRENKFGLNTFETSEAPNSTATFPKDESLDLDILRKINEAIENCTSSNYDLKETLKSIGDLSNQISYNKQSIRNQHGPLLQKIYHLKVIISDDSFCSSISKEELENVKQCLPFLKEKINSILMESLEGKKIILENINFQEKLLPFTYFSTKYHEQLVFNRIRNELDQMEPIDFRIQIDRYYFARSFCIIGELFNEWRQDKTEETKKLLQGFVKLRGNFVHEYPYYQGIKSGLENQNKSIYEIIDELKDHLTKIIVKEDSDGLCWKIDLLYDCEEDFRKPLRRLMGCFNQRQKNIDKNKQPCSNIEDQSNQSSNSIDNSQNSPDKVKRDFETNLEAMMEEFDLIFEHENRRHNQKEKYSIQHAMVLVAEFVKGICQTLENAKKMNSWIFPYLHILGSLPLTQNIKKISKDIRNEGLAHNIWIFDEKKFFQRVDELKKVYKSLFRGCILLMEEVLTISSFILFILGMSFSTVNLNKESSDDLEKLLKEIKKHLKEINEIKISFDNDNKKFRKSFQLHRTAENIYNRTKEAYNLMHNLIKSKENARFLCDLLKIDKIKNLPSMLEKNADHLFLLLFQRIEESKDEAKIKQLNEFGKSSTWHYRFQYSYADLVYEDKKFERSKQMYKDIFENAPFSPIQLQARIRFIDTCFEITDGPDQSSDIDECLNPLESIFEHEPNDIISMLPNTFATERIKIIDFRLRYFIKFSFPFDQSVIGKIKNISATFKEFSRKFIKCISDDCLLYETCAHFNEAFLWMISMESKDKTLIFNEIYLYLSMAEYAVKMQNNPKLRNNFDQMKEKNHKKYVDFKDDANLSFKTKRKLDLYFKDCGFP